VLKWRDSALRALEDYNSYFLLDNPKMFSSFRKSSLNPLKKLTLYPHFGRNHPMCCYLPSDKMFSVGTWEKHWTFKIISVHIKFLECLLFFCTVCIEEKLKAQIIARSFMHIYFTGIVFIYWEIQEDSVKKLINRALLPVMLR